MKPQQLSDIEFAKLRKLAHSKWGIDINPNKIDMINGRLQRLIKDHTAESLTDLIRRLDQGGDAEFELSVFDVLSTNMTSFFREKEHFDCMLKELVAPMAARGGTGSLRIWSAACSKGCEPYSMSMVIRDSLPNFEQADVKILASDLSRSVVSQARRGVYPAGMVTDLPENVIARHFIKGQGPAEGKFKVHPAVASKVTFGLVNLVGPWPHSGPFDAIFCRNVMIYFDEPTRNALITRLQGLLRPGGLLVLGSSEALSDLPAALTRIQPAVYRAA